MQREFSYSQLQSSKVYFKLENLSYCISNVTNENNSTKVLGLMWNIKHDTLQLNFQEHMLLIQDPPTKLLLIKYFNSLHDSFHEIKPFHRNQFVNESNFLRIPRIVKYLLLRGGMLIQLMLISQNSIGCQIHYCKYMVAVST